MSKEEEQGDIIDTFAYILNFGPAKRFCVCTSSTTGVYFVSFFNFLTVVILLATTESAEPVNLAGITIEPLLQTGSTAWGLIGVPIMVLATVGNAYRIEYNLRLFYYYINVSIVLFTCQVLYYLFNGNTCAALITTDVRSSSLGKSNAICGFVESFVFFWIMFCIILFMYFSYIVWSECQWILLAEKKRMMDFGDCLEKMQNVEQERLLPRSRSSVYGHNT